MQKGELDHLTFRKRFAISIVEGKQRKFTKRSKPSQLGNVDSRYDSIDYLIISKEKQTRRRQGYKKCQQNV